MDNELLLTIPFLLPTQVRSRATYIVQQAIDAFDLIGCPPDLEIVIGVWELILKANPQGDDLHVLKLMVEAVGESSTASIEDVVELLDAMLLLDDLRAVGGPPGSA